MTVEEIIALCHAGYNSDQIMHLAQAQQMERAQQRAQQRRCRQYAEAHSAVAPGKGKYLPQAAPEGLVFRISRHIHQSSPSI